MINNNLPICYPPILFDSVNWAKLVSKVGEIADQNRRIWFTIRHEQQSRLLFSEKLFDLNHLFD